MDSVVVTCRPHTYSYLLYEVQHRSSLDTEWQVGDVRVPSMPCYVEGVDCQPSDSRLVSITHVNYHL